MARIMAIDFGLRRVGIATTDPLQIISSPLATVDTQKIFDFLTEYLAREEVEKIVVGWPTTLMQKDTHATEHVRKFCIALETKYPQTEVIQWDERYTSKIAKQTIIDSGIGKMKRRDKNLIDKISASLILQSYLGT